MEHLGALGDLAELRGVEESGLGELSGALGVGSGAASDAGLLLRLEKPPSTLLRPGSGRGTGFRLLESRER